MKKPSTLKTAKAHLREKLLGQYGILAIGKNSRGKGLCLYVEPDRLEEAKGHQEEFEDMVEGIVLHIVAADPISPDIAKKSPPKK